MQMDFFITPKKIKLNFFNAQDRTVTSDDDAGGCWRNFRSKQFLQWGGIVSLLKVQGRNRNRESRPTEVFTPMLSGSVSQRSCEVIIFWKGGTKMLTLKKNIFFAQFRLCSPQPAPLPGDETFFSTLFFWALCCHFCLCLSPRGTPLLCHLSRG